MLRKLDIERGVIAALTTVAASVTLIPVALRVGRPLLKGAVKGGIVCLEQGRRAVHETFDIFEEVLAEVRVEMDSERKRASPPPAEPAEADELVEATPAGGAESGPIPAG